MAFTVHRASRTSCGERGRRWAARDFRVASEGLRELRSADFVGTYTEPPGPAAARMCAAGPCVAFAWQAQE